MLSKRVDRFSPVTQVREDRIRYGIEDEDEDEQSSHHEENGPGGPFYVNAQSNVSGKVRDKKGYPVVNGYLLLFLTGTG